MDKSSSPVSFDHAKCSGCFELVCVGVCPQGIIEIDRENRLCITEISLCTSCGVCANLCPTRAITIGSKSPIQKDQLVSK
ncbi:TPA: 4Fe-4S binding protein [Candidatus Bathyarchaeota archaeon]|nr:4Fe-4S binding protein [Candidatus Bathyarchaeota archaeon]HIJ08840.1 4Fe-4S binding protein [Candidatus Bathyarchaeota archaeon]